MTGLAIIIGLGSTVNAKTNIIIALLIIAIADNVSDSFGIHIHQESQSASSREVRRTTLLNFLARLLMTAVFILLIVLFSIPFATVLSVILGLSVIMWLSYSVSRQRRVKPFPIIFEHLLLAIAVIVVSFLLRDVISQLATKIVT
jgi:VIT1/CCC1 family predicted Fe2+/Mn2+ transporter